MDTEWTIIVVTVDTHLLFRESVTGSVIQATGTVEFED